MSATSSLMLQHSQGAFTSVAAAAVAAADLDQAAEVAAAVTAASNMTTPLSVYKNAAFEEDTPEQEQGFRSRSRSTHDDLAAAAVGGRIRFKDTDGLDAAAVALPIPPWSPPAAAPAAVTDLAQSITAAKRSAFQSSGSSSSSPIPALALHRISPAAAAGDSSSDVAGSQEILYTRQRGADVAVDLALRQINRQLSDPDHPVAAAAAAADVPSGMRQLHGDLSGAEESDAGSTLLDTSRSWSDTQAAAAAMPEVGTAVPEVGAAAEAEHGAIVGNATSHDWQQQQWQQSVAFAGDLGAGSSSSSRSGGSSRRRSSSSSGGGDLVEYHYTATTTIDDTSGPDASNAAAAGAGSTESQIDGASDHGISLLETLLASEESQTDVHSSPSHEQQQQQHAWQQHGQQQQQNEDLEVNHDFQVQDYGGSSWMYSGTEPAVSDDLEFGDDDELPVMRIRGGGEYEEADNDDDDCYNDSHVYHADHHLYREGLGSLFGYPVFSSNSRNACLDCDQNLCVQPELQRQHRLPTDGTHHNYRQCVMSVSSRHCTDATAEQQQRQHSLVLPIAAAAVDGGDMVMRLWGGAGCEGAHKPQMTEQRQQYMVPSHATAAGDSSDRLLRLRGGAGFEGEHTTDMTQQQQHSIVPWPYTAAASAVAAAAVDRSDLVLRLRGGAGYEEDYSTHMSQQQQQTATPTAGQLSNSGSSNSSALGSTGKRLGRLLGRNSAAAAVGGGGKETVVTNPTVSSEDQQQQSKLEALLPVDSNSGSGSSSKSWSIATADQPQTAAAAVMGLPRSHSIVDKGLFDRSSAGSTVAAAAKSPVAAAAAAAAANGLQLHPQPDPIPSSTPSLLPQNSSSSGGSDLSSLDEEDSPSAAAAAAGHDHDEDPGVRSKVHWIKGPPDASWQLQRGSYRIAVCTSDKPGSGTRTRVSLWLHLLVRAEPQNLNPKPNSRSYRPIPALKESAIWFLITLDDPFYHQPAYLLFHGSLDCKTMYQ